MSRWDVMAEILTATNEGLARQDETLHRFIEQSVIPLHKAVTELSEALKPFKVMKPEPNPYDQRKQALDMAISSLPSQFGSTSTKIPTDAEVVKRAGVFYEFLRSGTASTTT